jgi:large subunit ribosomal protein L32
MRRAHHDKVTAPNVIACPNCGDMMLPHRICPACGHYKGRKIVEPTGGQTESGAS